MHRTIFILLIATILHGCTTVQENLVGKPVYSKHDDHVMWENITVYGKLKKEVLRTPTQVYQSSFGHAYCMAEDVTFEVAGYIQGSGPSLIEFTQNKIDSCSPLANDIGFGESILFISKNQYRGIWSTGSARVNVINGERRIFRPSDIVYFSLFDNFESVLSAYEEPLEWSIEKSYESDDVLSRLAEKGVLSYKLDSNGGGGEFYSVTLFKYIGVAKLLTRNF